MLSEQIRSRLEQLNRQRLPELATSGSEPSLPGSATTDPVRADESAMIAMVRYLEAGREVENTAGAHLVIRHPLARFGTPIVEQLGRARQAWSEREPPAEQVHPDIVALGRSFPGEALFLDLETCGLGGAMIFLVGLLHATDDGLIIEQLLARNYAEERAMLATLWQIAAGKQLLVTFNGKSFDWPLVHDRSTLHRLGRRDYQQVAAAEVTSLLQPHEPRPELAHLDVLHHARRRWRQRLPNCRLQTLERYLCRRVRCDDVPGHEIPAAYHDFVRSGNPRLIESILHHNALDLVTMTQVAMRMLYESSAETTADELWPASGSCPAGPGATSSPVAAAAERIG